MPPKQQLLAELAERVSHSVKQVRGRRVLLDVDLAGVYGVTIASLRRSMTRNAGRFPGDLAFRLSPSESRCLERIRIRAVWAFTDEGSLMLANVLKSPVAAEVSVRFVRALVAGAPGEAFEFFRRSVEKAR